MGAGIVVKKKKKKYRIVGGRGKDRQGFMVMIYYQTKELKQVTY